MESVIPSRYMMQTAPYPTPPTPPPVSTFSSYEEVSDLEKASSTDPSGVKAPIYRAPT